MTGEATQGEIITIVDFREGSKTVSIHIVSEKTPAERAAYDACEREIEQIWIRIGAGEVAIEDVTWPRVPQLDLTDRIAAAEAKAAALYQERLDTIESLRPLALGAGDAALLAKAQLMAMGVETA